MYITYNMQQLSCNSYICKYNNKFCMYSLTCELVHIQLCRTITGTLTISNDSTRELQIKFTYRVFSHHTTQVPLFTTSSSIYHLTTIRIFIYDTCWQGRNFGVGQFIVSIRHIDNFSCISDCASCMHI